MGFRINTNIAALNAHNNATLTNRALDKSLSALSSGLRINSAADDASGLVISDSLRSQANSLGQAVRNANDAIGIIQTADKAMDEQIKILDTIKTKAIQAASDSQSSGSREAIQQDVDRLIDSLNNIAHTTSFNGQSLLAGEYVNKEFQVGAYSNQTVEASIGNTEALAIGNIQQTSDSTALGNIVSTTAEALEGSKFISVAATDLNGLGRGDLVSFDGGNTTYAVQNVISSSGTIELAVPLNADVALGDKLSVKSEDYANNPRGYLEIATGVASGDTELAVDVSQLRGLAVGDTVTVVNSLGTSDSLTVAAITSAGLVSFGAGTITSVAAFANLKMYVESDAKVSQTSLSAGASNLSSTTLGVVAAGTGYAIGDVIEITNGTATEQFVIEGVNTSNGTVTLNNAMATAFSAGSTISVIAPTDNVEHLKITASLTSVSTSITLADTTLDIRGLAAGDVLTVIADDGSRADVTISNIITSTGVISFASAIGLTAGVSTTEGGIIVKTADVLGSPFTGEDYAQYTVEGTKIDGVQITDSSGNGVPDTGLGRVAQQINIVSDITGVTATADVSAKGTIAVQGTVLSEDMTINGVLVVNSGTTILDADTDQKLISAINGTTNETGVSATLIDGVLKLESDGRAMTLEGFTSVAGIVDGVVVGELDFTALGTSPIDISAIHYTNADLSTVNANASTAVDVDTTAFTLADLSSGRVDDNEDGVVDDNDITGLLRTRQGAMVAIDVAQVAINELDSTRSGLGSAQNELTVTVNNISVTAVNVKAAESQIRDVDFAAESANFSKNNILAQSGSYAMSQANAIQQNVLSLLQ